MLQRDGFYGFDLPPHLRLISGINPK